MSHSDRIHALPCVVCYLLLDKFVTPVQWHHLESVRDELTDFSAVPMCEHHHSELHRLSRRGFERSTKLTPIDLLAGTILLLMEYEE